MSHVSGDEAGIAAAGSATHVRITLPRKLRGFVLDRESARPLPGVAVAVLAETKDGAKHLLGLLASDRAGYLSFDLGALGGVETSLRHLWVHAVASAKARVDCLRPATADAIAGDGGGVGAATGAVVGQFLLPAPASVALADQARSLPSVQSPDEVDWRLSPYSFSRPLEATVGTDGCATPYPSAGAARDFIFYRVVRRPPRRGEVKMDREAEVGYAATARMRAAEIEPVNVTAGSPSRRVEQALVVEMRQRWIGLNDSLGEIVYSAALAPCESVNLAVIDWSRRDSVTRTDAATATEALYHGQRRDRTIEETVDATVEESQGGWSLMGGVSAAGATPLEGGGSVSGTAALGAGVSNSWGERTVEADSQQDLHDRIKQRTTLVRGRSGTVVIEATQDERNVLETRTVTNHNHCHALTLQYYEVLRNFRLVTEVLRVRPAVLVPFALLTFTPSLALRFRAPLESRLLDPPLAACFDALERLERCPDLYTLAVEPEPAKPGSAPLPSGTEEEDERFVSRFDITIGTTLWNSSTTWGDVWVELFLTSTSSWKEIWHKEAVGRGGVELNTLQWPQSVGGKQIDPADIQSVRVGWREANGNDSWDFESIRIDYTIAGESGTHILVDERGTTVPPTSKSKKIAIHFFDDAESKVDTRALAVRPPPAKKPAPTKDGGTTSTLAPKLRYSRTEDKCCADRLVAHLNANYGYYSRIVWVLQDPVERRLALAAALAGHAEILGRIDDTPLAVSGNHLAFAYTADGQVEGAEVVPPAESIISLPSRGLFAEAQLGHCNACEKRDVTRYWQWEESPCERPTPIEDITPGPRGQAPTVEPAAVPTSVLQVIQPPAAPDPTGLAAALSLLGRGDVFRDMSGLREVRELLSGLAEGSIDLAKATQLAEAANERLRRGDSVPMDGARGPVADQRTAAERYDDLQVAREVAGAASELGWDDKTTAAVTSGIVGGRSGPFGALLDLVQGAVPAKPKLAVRIEFKGNFQCRLATDPDPSDHPRGLNGWTFAHTGEPDFDRFIRFNNPVAPRKCADAVGVQVTRVLIDGKVVVDPLTGQPVNLGPTTFFDGAAGPPGMEPLANFELRIDGSTTFLRGRTALAPVGKGMDDADPQTLKALKVDTTAAFLQRVAQRKACLQAAAAAATGAAKTALNDRIAAADAIVPPNDIRYQALRYVVPYGGALDTQLVFAAAGKSKAIDEIRAHASPKPKFELRFSAFDGDGLVGRVEGFVEI